MKIRKQLFLSFLFITFFVPFFLSAQMKVLSGFEGGSYFQMANELNMITDVELKVIPTEGSRDNFFKLKSNNADIAFLQYDVLFYQTGYMKDESKSVKKMKILLPLGYEEIHLITKKDSRIRTIKDLKRKKVGVGSKLQGTIVTSGYIRKKLNGKWKEVRIPFDDALESLEKGRIDAFFFVGSAPVKKLNTLTGSLKDNLKLIPITNPKLNDYYAKTTIKAGTYNWLNNDIETYSVRYALVTNTINETIEDKEYLRNLLDDIKNNIDVLKKDGHRMWENVDFNFDRILWDIHPISVEIFNLEKKEHKF